MGSHTIIFTPSGIQTKAEDKESVYDVALRAGVDMQSICGGKGLCKRCQIDVSPGAYSKFKVTVGEDALSKLSPTEKKAIHDGDMARTDARR